jgi:hypothetical protein
MKLVWPSHETQNKKKNGKLFWRISPEPLVEEIEKHFVKRDVLSKTYVRIFPGPVVEEIEFFFKRNVLSKIELRIFLGPLVEEIEKYVFQT